MVSNHNAEDKTLLLGAKGRGREIAQSHPEKKPGYKVVAKFEGMKGDIIQMITFQRHRRRSYNIMKNSIYLSQLLPTFTCVIRQRMSG